MTLAYTIELNADGSAIVKLAEPVKLRGEELTRLTIPRLTGRHMRFAPWTYAAVPTVGQVVEFASHVIQPDGVLDELDATLARDLAVEVALVMGKSSRATGAAPSGT